MDEGALLKRVVDALFPEAYEYEDGVWRSGSKGSKIFNYIGPYAGRWRDWETSERGNAYELVKVCLKVDYEDAKKWIEELLDGETPTLPEIDEETRARAEKKAAAKRTALQVLAAHRKKETPDFVRRYFVSRGTWPAKDEELGWAIPLPKNIYWIPNSGATRVHFLSAKTALGAIAVPLCVPGKPASALELSYAISRKGVVLDSKSKSKWRRSKGSTVGKVYIPEANREAETIVLVEGLADALAVYKLGIPKIEIRAVVGVGKMDNELVSSGTGGVVFVPDSNIEETIMRKIERRRTYLIDRGRQACIVRAEEGDPDNWLQGWTHYQAKEKMYSLKNEGYTHTDAVALLLQEST